MKPRPFLGASLAATSRQRAPAPVMSLTQAELFTEPGSLANAWGDYDNDGDLDLAVSSSAGIRLYRNDRGVFSNAGASLGVTAPYEIRGVSWGDYDRDGWLDLVAGPIDTNHTTLLFHNDGGRRFAEVARSVGLEIRGRSARVTNWIDFDNDGDLDVYATNRSGANSLYRNDRGRFELVVKGAADPRPTVGACWLDYDRDGDLDVFLANQSGTTDALWRNDGTGFTDVAPQLGIQSSGRSTAEGGVGCAVGDYDNDGHLDIFLAAYGRNALYRSNGNGTFANVAATLGMDGMNHAVSGAWGDYDNDGLLDLFVASYEGASGGQVPANALFHNRGTAGFESVLTPSSALNAADHGSQWVDYDGDGALDLSLTRGYGPVGGHTLFHNELSRAESRRSLSVTVLDADGRHTRAGAEVRLFDSAGRILATRQISAGEGYGSQSAAPVHFGLKRLLPVTVEVTFMGATGRRLQVIRGVDPVALAGRSLVVRESRSEAR